MNLTEAAEMLKNNHSNLMDFGASKSAHTTIVIIIVINFATIARSAFLMYRVCVCLYKVYFLPNYKNFFVRIHTS